MVVQLFGEVENKNVPVPEFPEHPFQEEQLRVSSWLRSFQLLQPLRLCLITSKNIRIVSTTAILQGGAC